MLIRVDEASERPIYAQIADSVRSDIVARRVGPGTVLPPARDVAAGLGINVHTVLRAYQDLRDEGLVDLRRRRGAVITAAADGVAELRDEVQALVNRAASLGIAPGTLAAVVESVAPERRTGASGGPALAAVTRSSGSPGEVPAA